MVMRKSLENFQLNIDDIKELLDLSGTLSSIEKKSVIFRSAVVLLIATWEQYIEQLADSSILVLTDRLRDASTLPENVKQEMALFFVPEKRSDMRKFSNSVWQFSDKGWKMAYKNYCLSSTSKLNTANSKQVTQLFLDVLGIRNVTSEWRFQELTSERCLNKLDDVVDLRHDIAHGANERVDELSEQYLREITEFVPSIALETFTIVSNHIAALSQTQAIEYSLDQACFTKIVAYAAEKENRWITLDEIKDLGSSAQGNHNKLCYEPWALLENLGKNKRSIPERLLDFRTDRISLPMEILVFDNKEAIAKPGTRSIFFSELRGNNS